MVQYLPVAQLLQPLCADSPTVLLYEPAGHSVTADEPKGQYPPALHCTHAVLPVSVWYVPAAHSSQAPMPARSAYVPVPHFVELVEPVRQYEPTGHQAQPDSAVSPAALLYLPVGHRLTADAPSAQYPPAVPH